MGSDDFFNTNGALGHGGKIQEYSPGRSSNYVTEIIDKETKIKNRLLELDQIALENKKTYLHVPYSDKEFARDNGAFWDKIKKQWYVEGEDDFLINRYGKDIEKIYLNVSFKYKDIAKSNGAKWDKLLKKWYVETEKEKINILNLLRSEKKNKTNKK